MEAPRFEISQIADHGFFEGAHWGALCEMISNVIGAVGRAHASAIAFDATIVGIAEHDDVFGGEFFDPVVEVDFVSMKIARRLDELAHSTIVRIFTSCGTRRRWRRNPEFHEEVLSQERFKREHATGVTRMLKADSPAVEL